MHLQFYSCCILWGFLQANIIDFCVLFKVDRILSAIDKNESVDTYLNRKSTFFSRRYDKKLVQSFQFQLDFRVKK